MLVGIYMGAAGFKPSSNRVYSHAAFWLNMLRSERSDAADDVAPPKVPFNAANPPSKMLTSAFAYLKDAAHIAEMGRAADASPPYQGITPALKAEFNSAFFNQTTGRCVVGV